MLNQHAPGYWDRLAAMLTLDALCLILLRLLSTLSTGYGIDLIAWGGFAIAFGVQLYALNEWDHATRPKKEAPPAAAEPNDHSDH